MPPNTVHAAVIAINEAVDKGQASGTLAALMNPNAMLKNTQEVLAHDYQDTLSRAKAHKEHQSSDRVGCTHTPHLWARHSPPCQESAISLPGWFHNVMGISRIKTLIFWPLCFEVWFRFDETVQLESSDERELSSDRAGLCWASPLGLPAHSTGCSVSLTLPNILPSHTPSPHTIHSPSSHSPVQYCTNPSAHICNALNLNKWGLVKLMRFWFWSNSMHFRMHWNMHTNDALFMNSR